MKSLKKLSTVLISITVLVFFFGCEKGQLTGPDEFSSSGTSDTQFQSFGKELTPTAITVEGLVTPDGGRLKTNSKNLNNADFEIHAGNISDSLTMRLVKLSETSNSYHFEPFGMDMPVGVKIKLEYSHSAMPYGVTEDDLQIFQLVEDTYVSLPSMVKKNKMFVHADVYTTGEFALGAYDMNGNFHLIEGEFGLRAEETINPKRGGTIRLGGGSYVEIPPNALNERTLIGIIATRETIMGKENSKGFTFTPHGTVFNTPVKLVLSWREMAGQPVELLYFNPTTNEWEFTSQGTWDVQAKSVTLEISHFSRYAIGISR